MVADRVVALDRPAMKLLRIGEELAGDGIARVVRVDQGRHGRADRHGIAGRNALQLREKLRRDKSGVGQIGRAPQGSDGHDGSPSEKGVQITWSMRVAPVASMTRRSRPRAMPLAGGMMASAAKKSSSIG